MYTACSSKTQIFKIIDPSLGHTNEMNLTFNAQIFKNDNNAMTLETRQELVSIITNLLTNGISNGMRNISITINSDAQCLYPELISWDDRPQSIKSRINGGWRNVGAIRTYYHNSLSYKTIDIINSVLSNKLYKEMLTCHL